MSSALSSLASCSSEPSAPARPPTAPGLARARARPAANGSVAGQVKALSADRQVSTLSGAQVILRGSKDTYTTVSSDVPADATGEAAYNYSFENIPAGTYTMAVTPPAGSDLQPEDSITVKVESGELFPQSVL